MESTPKRKSVNALKRSLGSVELALFVVLADPINSTAMDSVPSAPARSTNAVIKPALPPYNRRIQKLPTARNNLGPTKKDPIPFGIGDWVSYSRDGIHFSAEQLQQWRGILYEKGDRGLRTFIDANPDYRIFFSIEFLEEQPVLVEEILRQVEAGVREVRRLLGSKFSSLDLRARQMFVIGFPNGTFQLNFSDERSGLVELAEVKNLIIEDLFRYGPPQNTEIWSEWLAVSKAIQSPGLKGPSRSDIFQLILEGKFKWALREAERQVRGERREKMKYFVGNEFRFAIRYYLAGKPLDPAASSQEIDQRVLIQEFFAKGTADDVPFAEKFLYSVSIILPVCLVGFGILHFRNRNNKLARSVSQ